MSTSVRTVLLVGIVLGTMFIAEAFVILQDENTTDHSGHHHLGGPEDVDALFPLALNDTDSPLPIKADDNGTDDVFGLGAQPGRKVDVVVVAPTTTDDRMTPGTDSGLLTPTTSDDVRTLPTETDKPHGSSAVPGSETLTTDDPRTSGTDDGLFTPTVTDDVHTLPTETDKPHGSSAVPGSETSTGFNFPTSGATENYPTGGPTEDFPAGGSTEDFPIAGVTGGFPTGGEPEHLPTLAA